MVRGDRSRCEIRTMDVGFNHIVGGMEPIHGLKMAVQDPTFLMMSISNGPRTRILHLPMSTRPCGACRDTLRINGSGPLCRSTATR
jgi:hypothetical protein